MKHNSIRCCQVAVEIMKGKSLGNNYKVVESRQNGLIKRLSSNEKLLQDYNEGIRESRHKDS